MKGWVGGGDRGDVNNCGATVHVVDIGGWDVKINKKEQFIMVFS